MTNVSTRGEQRAAQIVQVATQLFQDLGYQNVSIDQIGAAVGLTGPAVYRHFKGKYAILVQALATQGRAIEELTDRVDREALDPTARLDAYLRGLSEITANGDEATVWRREQRHLKEAERDRFLADFSVNRERIAAKIIAVKPHVTADEASLMAFAILTMHSNTPSIRGSLPPERLIEIQLAVCSAIIGSPLGSIETRTPPVEVPPLRKAAGRRERILSVSTMLFDERGFYDVRIDDIAKASDLSVTALYQLVSGKTEVLRAILERGAEGLLYATAEALAYANTPQEVLDALITTYIQQSLGVHGRTMHILNQDLLYLSPDEQSALRETQREYVAEWVQAIQNLSGNLTESDARALTQAAIGVITDASQSPTLRTRTGIAEELFVLSRSMVLGANLPVSV